MIGRDRPPETFTSVDRGLWEREMRRVHVIARVLGALLLALVIRLVTSRPTLLLVIAAGVIAALLVGSIGLVRRGHRLEPGPRSERPEPR